MKKKQKMDFGGIISGLFGTGGNIDPMVNVVAQQYQRMLDTPGFMESPDATLADNNIRKSKALLKTESNPLTKGLDFLGALSMQAGSTIMGGAETGLTVKGDKAATDGVSGFLNKLFGQVGQAGQKEMAYGGRVPGHPVEVEGKEVGELPNGQIIDFQGPSHEAGGIDAILPESTKMFSKRIKIDGKTMAQRKLDRERRENKVDKSLKDNKSDTLLKNTKKRLALVNKKEDESDLLIQEAIAAEMKGTSNKAMQNTNDLVEYQLGTGPEGILGQGNIEEIFMPIYKALKGFNKPGVILPEPAPTVIPTIDPQMPYPISTSVPSPAAEEANKNTAGKPTLGDAMGMWGNLKQGFDPYLTTLENRAGDTPNVNSYKDFGKDGLEVLNKSKNYITGARDESIQDLLLSKNANTVRNRNSARSINTQRALDIASESGFNKALTSTYSDFANKMIGVLSQESQMENAQDQMVMKGEEFRDTADRQDRDAFYSNVARDQVAIGEAVTRTGKSVNDIKARGVNQEFLNALSQYLDIDLTTGKLRRKAGVDITGTTAPVVATPEEATTTSKKIEENVWNNAINPLTQKVFASEKEYKDEMKKREGNPYFQPFAESDTSYKKFVKDDGSKFTSLKDYKQYTEAGRTAGTYKRVTGEGNTFVKGYNTKANVGTVEKFAEANNLEINFDDKSKIMELQKMLGLPASQQTGNIGKLTLEAMKKYNKK